MNLRGFARFLSLLGIPARGPANAADATVGAATLGAAAFVGGFITRTGSTAAYTDTTPTITNLVAALPGGQQGTGLSWELQIRNNTSWVETLAAGTGATLSGITVIPPFTTLTALVSITSPTTYTVLGVSLAPVMTNVFESVVTTNVIAASENGATFFLNLAVGFLSTLPPPALGLNFRFLIGTAPTGGAGYTITTTSSAAIIFGPTQSAAGGSSGIGNAEALLTLVNDAAKIGDRVDFVSDGTNWMVSGYTCSDTGITIA